MKIDLSLSAIALLTIVVGGCASPYYGYSEREWASLSDAEKSAITSDYDLVIESRRKLKHQQVIDARTKSIIELGAGKIR